MTSSSEMFIATQSESIPEGGKWDEFALAHCPSLVHFGEMLAIEDYDKINKQYRIPALKDTCTSILFTNEIEVERLISEESTKAGLQIYECIASINGLI